MSNLEHSIQKASNDLDLAFLNCIDDAASFHGVPKSTLGHRRAGRPSTARTERKSQRLTNEEEKVIVQWLKDIQKQNLCLTYPKIRELVTELLKNKDILRPLYKGSDRTTLRLTTEENDEVHQYTHGRYIGPSEAIWRLFEYPVHEEFPPVIPLAVHLPGQHIIYFQPDDTTEEIQQRLETSYSTLTAFFRYNAEHEHGRHFLYSDFPTHFVFDKRKREWHPRQRGTAIGRIYHCTPLAGERYYLRLLLTVIRGPPSYEWLRMVNGTLYPTFQSACVVLGLIKDNGDWIDCFTEAAIFSTGFQLRALFVLALVHGAVAEPLALWERLKTAICDDLAHVLNQRIEISTV